jgi:molecular chaperone DnaK
MQREAEAHAAEDSKRKEEIETRNAADTLAYTAEKTLREQKDKIPSDLNQEVESKIQAVRSALQGTDINNIRQATQKLSDIMQKIGAAVYGRRRRRRGRYRRRRIPRGLSIKNHLRNRTKGIGLQYANQA